MVLELDVGDRVGRVGHYSLILVATKRPPSLPRCETQDDPPLGLLREAQGSIQRAPRAYGVLDVAALQILLEEPEITNVEYDHDCTTCLEPRTGA